MKTLTYGTMPGKKAFSAAFEKHAGTSYSYTFRGEDAEIARAARIPASGTFTGARLYAIVKKLRDVSEKDVWYAERAGNMASAILDTLDFEWV